MDDSVAVVEDAATVEHPVLTVAFSVVERGASEPYELSDQALACIGVSIVDHLEDSELGSVLLRVVALAVTLATELESPEAGKRLLDLLLLLQPEMGRDAIDVPLEAEWKRQTGEKRKLPDKANAMQSPFALLIREKSK